MHTNPAPTPAPDPSTAAAARPTDVLYAEHRVIERVLGVLEALGRRARTGAELDVADARAAVRFVRRYADHCHHGKEEAELFPAMERGGLPRDVGPTAVMRAEHDEGRAHVRAMVAALDAEPLDRAGFARHAGAFALLLRDHIAKEDQVLFPMAEQMLGPQAAGALLETFRRLEPELLDDAERAELLADAARLAAAYGVPESSGPQAGPRCCG